MLAATMLSLCVLSKVNAATPVLYDDCPGCPATANGGAVDMTFDEGVSITLVVLVPIDGNCAENSSGDCEPADPCTGTVLFSYATGISNGIAIGGFRFTDPNNPPSDPIEQGRLPLGSGPGLAGSQLLELPLPCGQTVALTLVVSGNTVNAGMTCGSCNTTTVPPVD